MCDVPNFIDSTSVWGSSSFSFFFFHLLGTRQLMRSDSIECDLFGSFLTLFFPHIHFFWCSFHLFFTELFLNIIVVCKLYVIVCGARSFNKFVSLKHEVNAVDNYTVPSHPHSQIHFSNLFQIRAAQKQHCCLASAIHSINERHLSTSCHFNEENFCCYHFSMKKKSHLVESRLFWGYLFTF